MYQIMLCLKIAERKRCCFPVQKTKGNEILCRLIQRQTKPWGQDKSVRIQSWVRELFEQFLIEGIKF